MIPDTKTHRGKSAALVPFILLLFAISVVPLPAKGQGQSQLTVTSQRLDGSSLTGYYTVLFQGGNVIATGFTPAVFSLVNGAMYVVQVDNYGSCNFDHWTDTGSSNPMRSISIQTDTQIVAVYNCGGSGSSVTVNSVDQSGHALSGFYVVLLEGGNVVSSGFTTTTLTTTAGASYGLQADSYGNCTFNKWSDGVRSNPRSFNASGSISFTIVYACGGGGGEGGGGPGTITIYDHRTPASYWAPCFATTCTNPLASCNTSCTGPGAAMWVALFDSSGNVVATGFSNENGLTFSGLSPTATYYLYPADCTQCHGSNHDVLFVHWGDTNSSSARPLPIVANGTFVDAWYTCTNGCTGGP